MKVASINISKREQLNSLRGLIETGIFKKPVAGKIKITTLGIKGDVIIDEAIHGGKDQAIYIYSLEDYEWWSRELGKTLLPGTFGENITLSGFSEQALVIGDRLKINDVVLEISAPRTPCFKLSARMEDPQFIIKFVKALRPGVYARVINEGELDVGDDVTFIKTDDDYATINDVFITWHSVNRSVDILRKALNSPISSNHRTIMQKWYDEKIDH